VNPVDVSRETLAAIQRMVGSVVQPWRLLSPTPALAAGRVDPPLTHPPAAGYGPPSNTGPEPARDMARPPPPPPAAEPPVDEDDLPPLEEVADRGPMPEVDSGPVRRPSEPPRVLAVANQKGGVGKTTTAVNLGACLAELGLRTLVVDLDPQGNASTGLGLNIRELDVTMYDVILQQKPIEDCIEPAAVRNLFVAPSSLDLAGAEIELVSAMSREMRLRSALTDIGADYDYVLIDCPPSLGLLTLNGLAAAGEVLVPIQCEYYALEGLGQLLRNVDLVKRNLNPTLDVSMIVLVMYDGRTTLAQEVAREVRQHFGDRVCDSVIPRTVRLSEAPSYGQPINTFDPRSRGADAYRQLAREVANGAS
jgi:chromosome partitioning protein